MKIRVTFEYDIVSPKANELHPADFTHCTSRDELLEELYENAPEMEWSVTPRAGDVDALWAAIQSLKTS